MAAAPPALRRVYPRVCGGTQHRDNTDGLLWGLSPRVRGNPGDGPLYRISTGSIPACAGEPPPAPTASLAYRVYPRVCGGTKP